ncbi:MAG TPA: hypothetical protein VIO83_09405 [Pseudomonas sp.]
MNTERTEKFVNAIACDLEEGGFRQVSGTMLRRTLATAVSAALPLLQPLPGTQSSRWAADGQSDPHGDRYACERAALALGHLTDDELANAVYLHGNEQPSMADLVAGKALSGIVYLTAAKERIRWLSRALSGATAPQPAELAEQRGMELPSLPASSAHDPRTGEPLFSESKMRTFAKAALAATGKQQVGEESAGLPEMCRSSTNAQGMQVGEVQGDARTQFEAWAHSESLSLHKSARDGEYNGARTISAWLAWQAALAARQPGTQMPALTFSAFRNANVSRCEKWHPEGIGSWSPSDWLTAAMGELGELASEVKMHNRVRDGLAGNKEQITPEERTRRMANEAADVVTYLDLFCAERGIDLGAALVRKFNEVSERVGFPDRLDPAAAQGIDLGRALDIMWNWQEQLGGHVFDARDVARTLTSSDMQAIGVDARACIDATNRNQAIVLAKREIVRALSSGQRDAAPGVGA